ncbi:LysE family translocator [Cellulophaga sp. 20_2_10]|uniref:LysE family translocator n=1 Tax=Cellulophaga sp. 20_2_10 TaxID=2942476 RepID=UPI00201AE19E|nr:LysE family translocator [Cellulophaga sp. 20_2_10]MCL5246921.1 LysE family translocator [Cellulophaga sp. 20_2_10]
MGIENFITFLFTAFIFIITPGIDTVFVLNKSIVQGKKSGIYATLGINTGILAHTLFAALGLSVLLSKSEHAFTTIKYAGFIYLIILGISKLKNSKKTVKFKESKEPKKGKNDFWSGFFTNTLNPKVALFVLAFFPQFINPTEIKNPIPFIVLGISFAVMGTLWYIALTFFASSFTQKINNNPNFNLWLNRLSGVAFILMGISIVLVKK